MEATIAPVIFTINGETTTGHKQQSRWNYKTAKWSLFAIRTNELKDFNNSILQAARECNPRRARRDYTPYWTDELERAHDAVTEAREETENSPTQENNIKLQEKRPNSG